MTSDDTKPPVTEEGNPDPYQVEYEKLSPEERKTFDDKMRAYGSKLLSTVEVVGQPTPMALCPTCGHSWPASAAPWTQQKLHCAKHDRVRNVGTTCEFCDEEARRVEVGNSGGDSVVAPNT